MKLVIVYDTKDNDTVTFFGTFEEVAKYFETTKKCIESTICKKKLRNWRYRLETIKIEEDEEI